MLLTHLLDRDDCREIKISNIMYDSREPLGNSIFFCLQGITNDGHSFITQAIENGAICIVHSREIRSKKEGIEYVFEPNLDLAFSQAVNLFFNYPSRKLKLMGITGTNGKTTVASLIYQLMSNQYKSGYIGTLGIKTVDYEIETNLTTEDLVKTQQILSDMVNNNISFCAMEVSSQGIELGRIDGLTFDCGVFTNLTQDHLDFHLNMESYFQAKKKLFSMISDDGFCIINVDDEYGKRLVNELDCKVITISDQDFNADIVIESYKFSDEFSQFKLKFQNEHHEFNTNIVGKYNIINLVEAMSVCNQYGISFKSMSESIKHLDVIEGRIERIQHDLDFQVYLDYAHTPDGFDKIMSFARSILKENGRLIAVFGSAGKRDKSKRPLMGEVADKYCDVIILTEDDPRDEVVSEISDEIASRIVTHPYVKIESRIEAINNAISIAKTDDIILVLGKGPEKVIHREKPEYYQGDKAVILASIDKRKEDMYVTRD